MLEKAKLEASKSIAISHSQRMNGFRFHPGVGAAGTPFSLWDCGVVREGEYGHA